MLRFLVHLQNAVLAATTRHLDPVGVVPTRRSGRLAGARGQATAEYALVLLGAAALALLVASWAAKTDVVGKLFDFALGHVIGLVK
jgi:hypothetical protein